MLFLTPNAKNCFEYLELSKDFGRYRTSPSAIAYPQFKKVLKESENKPSK
jgi:hypothetical protein